jgi:hypothetical protein
MRFFLIRVVAQQGLYRPSVLRGRAYRHKPIFLTDSLVQCRSLRIQNQNKQQSLRDALRSFFLLVPTRILFEGKAAKK